MEAAEECTIIWSGAAIVTRGRKAVRIGDVDIHVLSDGEFMIDGGAVFGLVPRVLWEEEVQPDHLNRVPMALNCLLIRSQGKRILVDTGYGPKVPPKRAVQMRLRRDVGLISALQRHDVSPEAVDIVINTHLHADHCGGNTVMRQGIPVPAFPNAQYWVQRPEWEAARSPNERTGPAYLQENTEPIASKMRLLEGETLATTEVRCVVTRGHTLAHQSVVIESRGHAAMCLGDAVPLKINLERLVWIAAFDTEPLHSLETKKRIRSWALDANAMLVFGHDPGCSAGRLHRSGDNWEVHPEAP